MRQATGRVPKLIGTLDDYPLREQVRDAIRDRITGREWEPGKRLTEQALADEFSVSRIPVREALRMLQSEGLVEVLPRRGAVVATLSRDELEDLFDVRGALEELTFRLAAKRATAESIATLERLLEDARAAVAKDDHDGVIAANAAFHESVSKLAGNQFLDEIYHPLSGKIRMLIGQSHEHERELAEHAQLVDAIREHDALRAARLAAAHIATSKEHALARLDAQVL